MLASKGCKGRNCCLQDQLYLAEPAAESGCAPVVTVCVLACVLNALLWACRDQVNPAECQASEISYFCEDYLRLGHNKMVMDPAVRVSYVPASWNHNL